MPDFAPDRLITADRRPVLHEGPVSRARPEASLRAGRLFDVVEKSLAAATDRLGRFLPENENPLARAGAVANSAFVVALVTGIVLLFWYRPSVGAAYASLESLSWFPQLLRSLHRYSSDLCMLFVLFHGLQTLASRKVAGARWLAWTTGVLLVGLLWLDGWTGYWLVWDERGQRVAVGTARFLDVLPVFSDPIARSFLVDETVNTLLFFLVFFIHMLFPLAMGIFLWLHILRLDRSKFFTGRALTIWLGVTLLAVSVLFPADSAGPASMQALPRAMTGDHWFLGPLLVIEKLPGGVLWLALAATTVLFYGIPWLMVRRRPVPSVVDPARCNGCTQCWQDCPFGAIALLPASAEGREGPVVAHIDPARCVGCGICVGSCDSTAIDMARLPVLDVRRWVNHAADQGDVGRLELPEPDQRRPALAFVCGASAGGEIVVGPDGSCSDLPGYRVLPVPCAGWVHMLTVERALRHGFDRVLIVGCGPDAPCREGTNWTLDRLAARRSPGLRADHVDTERVRFVAVGSGGMRAVQTEAQRFAGGSLSNRGLTPTRSSRVVAGTALALLAGLVVLGPSDASLPTLSPAGSELVVSFKHAGQTLASGETVDDSNVLPHMRRSRSAERGRHPVRMRIELDGKIVVDKAYEPGGLFSDGTSLAVERIPVSLGEHVVRVSIADAATPDSVAFFWVGTPEFTTEFRRTLLFENPRGFTLY